MDECIRWVPVPHVETSATRRVCGYKSGSSWGDCAGDECQASWGNCYGQDCQCAKPGCTRNTFSAQSWCSASPTKPAGYDEAVAANRQCLQRCNSVEDVEQVSATVHIKCLAGSINCSEGSTIDGQSHCTPQCPKGTAPDHGRLECLGGALRPNICQCSQGTFRASLAVEMRAIVNSLCPGEPDTDAGTVSTSRCQQMLRRLKRFQKE